MNIKQKIFDIIQPDHDNSVVSRLFDWVITALILASVVSVFAVTFDLPENVRKGLETFEAVASSVFTVEYLLRIWTADKLYPEMSPVRARFRYVVSFLAIIDLVAILPFWLPWILPGSMLGVRALRLVRLLRILKLNRYSDAMKSLGEVIVGKRRELIGSTVFVFLLMMLSSLLMYAAEHDVQPKVFKNAFSGLWWVIATLTTVGCDDVYPETVLGRILCAVIALAGVAALAIPTGIITSGFMERIEKKDFDDEVATRVEKDAEHDRLLAEQRQMLKTLDEKLDRLLAQQRKTNG